MTTKHVHPASLSPLAPPAKSKVRFDGSCCLNLRSITGALKLLEAAGKGEPLTTKELMSVLWFVEMCVMYDAFYFDGTEPKEDVAAGMEQIGRVADGQNLSELAIRPIRFSEAQGILLNARAAMLESTFLLANLHTDPALDQRIGDHEHETFRNALRSADGLGEADRGTLALELIERNFRGSKCVAALIAAGPDALALASRAYETHPEDGALMSAAMINRFRLNYLNQLSSWRNAVFAADPGFEPLSEQHRKLFHQYLLREVAEGLDAGRANIIAENMRQDSPLPPIGLFALMLTRERGEPMAILHTALTYFKHDTALQKLLWKHTEEGLRIPRTDPDLRTYGAEVEELFRTRYGQLDRRAEVGPPAPNRSQTVRKYLIPAVLGAIGGLVSVPAVGLLGLVAKVLAGTAVGSATSALGDALLAGGCDSYVAQYKSLKYDFGNAKELAVPLSAVDAQVRSVFGRELVPG